MYKCSLPPFHDLRNLDEAFNRLRQIDPVVVFLDPQKVMDAINRNFPFDWNDERMANIHNWLDQGKFELPVIKDNGVVIQVYEGRHRTLAMLERSEKSVPYLTAKLMAPQIKNVLGARIQLQHFDLSDCLYSAI